MSNEQETKVTIKLPKKASVIKERVNTKTGVKGFQKVDSKRTKNVTVRFTEDEFKEIEKYFNRAKGSVIRSVFLQWMKGYAISYSDWEKKKKA